MDDNDERKKKIVDENNIFFFDLNTKIVRIYNYTDLEFITT